jgi:molybdopterin-guanine dinucleotide biosynthesis protein
LETVIPKIGGTVMIVNGNKNVGKTGTLMSKQTNEKGNKVAVVQLATDYSVDQYELDDICQYSGREHIY